MNDQPPKTSDEAFANGLINEHNRLADEEPFSAAERQVIRELLGFVVELRALVKDLRWEAETRNRVSGFGVKSKAIATWITAIAAAGSLCILAAKQLLN